MNAEKKPDNPNVYPDPLRGSSIIHPQDAPFFGEGISLRDHFAGVSLTGLISNKENFDYLRVGTADLLAKDAYAIADAMLVARERRDG